MSRMPIEISAVERSSWLAELAEALEQAQKLAWHLGVNHDRGADVMALYGQLEAARLEVQALRLKRGNRVRNNVDPEWPELLPWEKNHAGPGA